MRVGAVGVQRDERDGGERVGFDGGDREPVLGAGGDLISETDRRILEYDATTSQRGGANAGGGDSRDAMRWF